jgi:hypothetical protein
MYAAARDLAAPRGAARGEERGLGRLNARDTSRRPGGGGREAPMKRNRPPELSLGAYNRAGHSSATLGGGAWSADAIA